MTTVHAPASLYQADDLLAGYDPGDPVGVTKTFDFQMYARFVRAQASTPEPLSAGLDFARHDAHIAHHLRSWVDAERPTLVGVMGGHSLRRDHPVYASVARLARLLTRHDYLVVTGGGPGAMEAAHVGAATASLEDSRLDAALDVLGHKDVAALPDLRHILTDSGEVDDDVARAAQTWFAAAYRVRHEVLPDAIDPSLAIPTWLYGNEPTNPFATVYAKYFSNSIREETLVNRSRAGIVYAQGGGGTLREVFEDFEDNFYAPSVKEFTPMVFFDVDSCWTSPAATGRPAIKIDTFLTEAVTLSRLPRGPEAFLAKVIYTSDETAIVDLLDSHRQSAHENMRSLLSGAGRARFMRRP